MQADIIQVEQLIFLLQEWQQNKFNNILLKVTES